jgi:hypothetical protein
MAMPLRTAPRITAFSPGQSPPLVRIPIYMFRLKFWEMVYRQNAILRRLEVLWTTGGRA